MNKLYVLLVLIFLFGCSSPFSRYEINEDALQTYVVKDPIKPPNEYYREIEDGDVWWEGIRKLNANPPSFRVGEQWELTHKIQDYYLIQSKSYNDRLCRHLDKNSGCYFVNVFGVCIYHGSPVCPGELGLLVNDKGVIQGGWVSLHDPCMFGTCSDKLIINPDNIPKNGWPSNAVFQTK